MGDFGGPGTKYLIITCHRAATHRELMKTEKARKGYNDRQCVLAWIYTAPNIRPLFDAPNSASDWVASNQKNSVAIACGPLHIMQNPWKSVIPREFPGRHGV